jgi:hypothetical protein
LKRFAWIVLARFTLSLTRAEDSTGDAPVSGDFDVDIDPVKKRSGDYPAILTNLQSAATAGFVRVGIIAARTPLRCYSVI